MSMTESNKYQSEPITALPPVPAVEVNQVLWDSSSMFICTYQDIKDLQREHTTEQACLRLLWFEEQRLYAFISLHFNRTIMVFIPLFLTATSYS